MKFTDKLKFVIRLPLSWLWRWSYSTPKVLSDFETIGYIREHNCSIARFGDGELDLMYGASIKFQKADKNLQKRLRSIAATKEQNNILICIPDILLNRKQLLEKFVSADAKWWRKHLFAVRGLWHKNFRALFYGDATLTRFYVELNDKERTATYLKELKSLWDSQNIVFVEGCNSRLGIGNDLFANAKSIRRILCPSVNAYERYNEIFNTVIQLTYQDDLIICALGPTATVLSYDLSHNNRRALDLGHVDIEYEWYLMGAQTQVVVKGKDMSEVVGNSYETEQKKPNNVIAEII